MLHADTEAMAHDVTVHCRIRRSPFATEPKFEEPREMTCTMRNWERPKRSSTPPHAGPELLLTPIRELLTNRDESPLRRMSIQEQQPQGHSFSIPVSDIMVLDYSTSRSQGLTLYITTLTYGYFEFRCVNRNGHDILLAFLRASLPKERVLDGTIYESDNEGKNCVRSSSSVTSCLDVDGLTSAHLQERVESETWPEKMSRRMGKVVNSLSELSTTICDYACCVDDSARDKPPTSSSSSPAGHQRHHHPQRRSYYSDLEMDDNESQLIRARQTNKRSASMAIHMPQRQYELSRKSSC